MRARTNTSSGSNPRASDSRPSILSSFGASFPSVRRGTWPLRASDTVQMKPFPIVLEAFIGEEDPLDRIRLGGRRIETRSLNIGVALAAMNARVPRAHRGGNNGDSAGQLALVFDDVKDTFVGWRPKVQTWGCGADKNISRPILEETVRAL